ncbi:hypothetical protein EV401DRAFT_1969648 [Pisolithus croceorrhizus]|nr:hypothetical protein EV401DRAFT_1969648 [Pisolithus croceorrhizus]
MSKYGTTTVTLVGHSLGAAISLLTSVFRTFTYGLPRVILLPNLTSGYSCLTHPQEDPIPICPGMFLGFVHPAGEVHIEDSGEWAACPGQDNPSTQCIVGDVPTILQGNESDHDVMGTRFYRVGATHQ